MFTFDSLLFHDEITGGPEPSEKELARAYVPFQQYSRRYSSEVALRKGTIFPELYQPYQPREK